MELLEGSDEIKRELLRKSAKHREEIEGEVRLITESTERIITNALVIGGSLALTYFIVKQLSGSSSKKSKHRKKVKLVEASSPEVVEVESEEPSSPGMINQIGAALISQASVLLLNLAKEKLSEYLQSATAPEKKSQP